MTQVGKVVFDGIEYRVRRDDGRNEYTVTERWYDSETHKWRTKFTGRYGTLATAMQDVAWTIKAREATA